jgi:hypothetical protein
VYGWDVACGATYILSPSTNVWICGWNMYNKPVTANITMNGATNNPA